MLFFGEFGIIIFYDYNISKSGYKGGLSMPLKTSKKAVAIGLSLSMIANISPQIYASDLVAFPQNNTSVIIPPNSTIVQSNSTEFSMKSIEEKINNILNPVEKEESKEAKLLVDDDSGSCGSDVTYTFTASTGELKISGSGAMTSYSSSSAPWYSYRSSIKSVTIGNSVNSIGDFAFEGCSGLNSITIPDSVNSIGDSAFSGCSGLNSITIPDSVNYIGSYAFSLCSGLTSITIPDSVNSIGDFAFLSCSGLTGQLTIPDSVTKIGSYAFSRCSGLTSITIPDSVNSFGDSAFLSCSGLTGQLTIPDSVNYIGSYAFSLCSGLNSVTYEGTSDPWASSSNVFVFDGCNLTVVNVPANYKDDKFCGLPIKKLATNPFTSFDYPFYLNAMSSLLNFIFLGFIL